jgi:hypothetical protein
LLFLSFFDFFFLSWPRKHPSLVGQWVWTMVQAAQLLDMTSSKVWIIQSHWLNATWCSDCCMHTCMFRMQHYCDKITNIPTTHYNTHGCMNL